MEAALKGEKNKTLMLLETETKINAAVFSGSFHYGMRKQNRLSKPSQNKKQNNKRKPQSTASLFPPPKCVI